MKKRFNIILIYFVISKYFGGIVMRGVYYIKGGKGGGVLDKRRLFERGGLQDHYFTVRKQMLGD